MKRIRLDISKCNEEYTIEELQKIVKTNFEAKGIKMKNYKRSEQSGTDIFNFDFILVVRMLVIDKYLGMKK